jgi:hypothetical protein
MTDRFNALTVILDQDICDDDTKELISVITMLRGVLKVKPHIVGFEDDIALSRAKAELKEKFYKFYQELSKD